MPSVVPVDGKAPGKGAEAATRWSAPCFVFEALLCQCVHLTCSGLDKKIFVDVVSRWDENARKQMLKTSVEMCNSLGH